MTRAEQRKFVNELIANVRKELMEKMPNVPEDWDGHELREWIADTFKQCSFTLRQQKRRYRDYVNAVSVHNL